MLNVGEEVALNRNEWKKRILVGNTKFWDKGFVVIFVTSTF